MKRVELRPLSIDDTDFVVEWRNSNRVKMNLFSQDDITSVDHLNYFHKYVEPGKIKQFVIDVIDDDVAVSVGTTFLKNFKTSSQSCEFGIFIGNDSFVGIGVGKRATQLTIEYAFNELDLKEIELFVFEDNINAIEMYKKCGFVEKKEFSYSMSCDGVIRNVLCMKLIK